MRAPLVIACLVLASVVAPAAAGRTGVCLAPGVGDGLPARWAAAAGTGADAFRLAGASLAADAIRLKVGRGGDVWRVEARPPEGVAERGGPPYLAFPVVDGPGGDGRAALDAVLARLATGWDASPWSACEARPAVEDARDDTLADVLPLPFWVAAILLALHAAGLVAVGLAVVRRGADSPP